MVLCVLTAYRLSQLATPSQISAAEEREDEGLSFLVPITPAQAEDVVEAEIFDVARMPSLDDFL